MVIHAHRRIASRTLGIACLALFACVVCLASLCVACSPGGTRTLSGSPYYDAAGFTQEGGRYLYSRDSGVAAKTGVDVSDHQGYVDWNAVADDGIGFAFIRVGYRGSTEGGLYRDNNFERNLSTAHGAHLDCGVYFYSQATSVDEAREEAEFVLAELDGEPLEYPIAFDYEIQASDAESRAANIGRNEATQIAQAFCSVIEAAGYNAMIYGNAYDLDRYNIDELEGYPVWFAEYGAPPSYTRPFTIWQYDNGGQVDGIDAAVDLNLDLS